MITTQGYCTCKRCSCCGKPVKPEVTVNPIPYTFPTHPWHQGQIWNQQTQYATC